MNQDTVWKIENIKSRGWYYTWQTLGEGGWAEVAKLASDWKTYQLTFLDSEDEPAMIVAKNDEAAMEAFERDYNLEEFQWRVSEKIVTYRLIKEKTE